MDTNIIIFNALSRQNPALPLVARSRDKAKSLIVTVGWLASLDKREVALLLIDATSQIGLPPAVRQFHAGSARRYTMDGGGHIGLILSRIKNRYLAAEYPRWFVAAWEDAFPLTVKAVNQVAADLVCHPNDPLSDSSIAAIEAAVNSDEWDIYDPEMQNRNVR